MEGSPQHDKENAGFSVDNIPKTDLDSGKEAVPCLASAIQEHLILQTKKMFDEEIFKESVVKCSLDKDFAYIFEESGLKINRPKPFTPIANTKLPQKVYNNFEKTMLNWIKSEEQKSLMHLPFRNYTQIFEILSQKVQEGKLIIVVTQHHQYLSERLEETNAIRKDPVRWASLSSSLDIETKSKILELYQLGRLELLMITPELFQNQKYQNFKCQALIISGVHLYDHHSELLERIVRQTSPQRILGCYEFLSSGLEKRLNWTNLGRKCDFENTIWLKGDSKCKNLLCYLSRREYAKVIIITRDKRSADQLSASLSLEAYRVCNFTQVASRQVFKSYSMPSLLNLKKTSHQGQLHQAIRKSHASIIVISPWFEALRLLQCDLVVFYDQPTIKQYMQLESLSENRLGLLSDQDYYICRNVETSSIVDRTIFEKLVLDILDKKNPRTNEKKVKRFYSDSLDELCSVDSSTSIKSITVNRYCSEFEILKPQLLGILDLLKDLNLLVKMEPVKYECLIQQRSAEQFRTTFPAHSLLTRRVNILNLASQNKTTTQNILDIMRSSNIRFLVCEELIPIRLLPCRVDSPVQTAWIHQQQQVLCGIRQIDLSYSLFDQFTFPNTQFLRREKILMKKKEMVSLFLQYQQGNIQLSRLPCLKINNVNKKTIMEWVHSVMFEKLTVHDMVLFLQGTLTQKTNIHQDDLIFKSFYKYKYEELAQLVEQSIKNKKMKLQ